MPGLPAVFKPDHLSLLPLQTLHRLRNLAASFSAALDDEFSRRQAQPRLAEEGLSPQSRALLLVGSRQLLHQALVFLDEPSSELSDSRSLALILLHIQRTNKAGVLGKSDHDDCLALSVLCDLVHNHGLPHILDRLLGSADADALLPVPDRLLVDFQRALQQSVGSLHALIEHQRTPHSFGEAVLDFLKLIRQYRSTFQVQLCLACRGMSPPSALHCYLPHACTQVSHAAHALPYCPS